MLCVCGTILLEHAYHTIYEIVYKHVCLLHNVLCDHIAIPNLHVFNL